MAVSMTDLNRQFTLGWLMGKCCMLFMDSGLTREALEERMGCASGPLTDLRCVGTDESGYINTIPPRCGGRYNGGEQ